MNKTIYSQAQGIFCEMLRKERMNAELTQVALSSRLKRPQSFVAKVEKGERRLDVIEFLRYAHAVGFDAPAFLKKLRRNHAFKD